MSLLIVGSVALDTVETPAGKVKDVLGGSATYASISASYFTSPHIVAVAGKDFPTEYIGILRKHKVNIDGLEIVNGKTFRWEGSYLDDLNRARTIDTQLNVFKDFNPKIPAEYRNIKFVFLANIDPQLQLSVYKQMNHPQIVACDTMNYWIENARNELKKVLKVIDILIINEAEIKQLAEEFNVIKSAKVVLKMGPKIIVVKRGEYGALCLYGGAMFVIPGYPLEDVVDPTGAGDSFAGGMMGYIAKCGRVNEIILRKAIVFGTIMGSFCVEDFSIKKIDSLRLRDIRQRYGKLKQLTCFDRHP